MRSLLVRAPYSHLSMIVAALLGVTRTGVPGHRALQLSQRFFPAYRL